MTADLWLDPTVKKLTVSAHFVVVDDGIVKKRDNLIAFRRIDSEYDALSLANTLLEVTDRVNITTNVRP